MKKDIYILSTLFVLIGFSIISCSKSNNNKITPPVSTCDTIGMKLALDIIPILQSNCYSCHGNGNSEGGIILDNYTSLKSHVVSGEIKGAITHASGYVGMPYLKPQLDTCTINKILDWIAQGAPNN